MKPMEKIINRMSDKEICPYCEWALGGYECSLTGVSGKQKCSNEDYKVCPISGKME